MDGRGDGIYSAETDQGDIVNIEDGSPETEASAVKPIRAPRDPTLEEIEAHKAGGHVPYRSWCRACVAGRGRSEPHRSVSHKEDAVPTIALDYGFFGEDPDDTSSIPILVTTDSHTGWPTANVVPTKGLVHPFGTTVLIREVLRSAYANVLLKSDQEHAIVAVKDAAMIKLKAMGVNVSKEEAPQAESQSNGLVEETVKRIKGVKQVKIVDDKAKGGVNFNLLLETEWEGKIEDTWENEATLKATKVFSSGSPAVLWTP